MGANNAYIHVMAESVNGGGPRVLVTDDNAEVLVTFCDLLRPEFTPVGAASCAEALALMREEPVDVALLDYNLPDGNGYTLLADLVVCNPRIRAVIITGGGMPSAGPVSIESHIVRCLVKPASGEALRSAVREALSASPES